MEELNKGYEFTKAQITELESLRAWKAEIEKQEPVAYRYQVEGVFGPVWLNHMPNNLYKIISTQPLYASPVVSPDVEKLIEERDELLSALDAIADAFGVGEDARKQLFVIVENAKNSARRSQCLSLIEAKFFTFEVEDEDGENVEDCMLNWGDDPDEYAARFGEAMSVIANAKCEEIKTELEAARKDAEWQPIETAPKTGRELILLLTPSNFPQVAYSNTWWTSGFSAENKPTHWKPLPEPPAIEQAKGGAA